MNTFETNSSSAHSVSIGEDNKEFVRDMIYPDEEGNIYLNGGEYGWEWFKTNNALEKANYVAQSSTESHSLLIDIIKNQTGCNEVFINTVDGYVDHQSCDIAPTESNEILRFIFDKNSWLFGGNDNGSAVPGFYDVEEYKQNGVIIHPKYNYELKIEGYNQSFKFKTYPTTVDLKDLLNGVDIRYNGWQKCVQFNAHYWANEDLYTVPYRDVQDISKEFIILVNENEWNNKWRTGSLTSQDMLDWVNENLDNPKIVYKLPFTIKEL